MTAFPPPPTALPFRLFDVHLKAIEPLSPSLCRFTFSGDDVALMSTGAPDQRIKLLFPSPDGQPPALPITTDWQSARRALPAAAMPPMRTYTLRRLNRAAGEVIVDFVLHGLTGPASTWATRAKVGDRLQMVAPNFAYVGDPGGYEWKPPSQVQRILLVGDETALPALAGILESLAQQRPRLPVQAFIEVPLVADCLDLRRGPATDLHWLPRERDGLAQGDGMRLAVERLAWLPAVAARPAAALDDVDLDTRILWETASAQGETFHAWIAGESATVMHLRRHLIQQRGLPRECLSLMGYWRAGRSLE